MIHDLNGMDFAEILEFLSTLCPFNFTSNRFPWFLESCGWCIESRFWGHQVVAILWVWIPPLQGDRRHLGRQPIWILLHWRGPFGPHECTRWPPPAWARWVFGRAWAILARMGELISRYAYWLALPNNLDSRYARESRFSSRPKICRACTFPYGIQGPLSMLDKYFWFSRTSNKSQSSSTSSYGRASIWTWWRVVHKSCIPSRIYP